MTLVGPTLDCTLQSRVPDPVFPDFAPETPGPRGMDATQQVHPHESEPPAPVTATAATSTRFAAASICPPSVELTNPVFDPCRPCHADAATIADGLHLKSERMPREDYAVPPLLIGEALFRHSGWKLQRQQTWEALQRVNPMSMACYRFANCGSAPGFSNPLIRASAAACATAAITGSACPVSVLSATPSVRTCSVT